MSSCRFLAPVNAWTASCTPKPERWLSGSLKARRHLQQHAPRDGPRATRKTAKLMHYTDVVRYLIRVGDAPTKLNSMLELGAPRSESRRSYQRICEAGLHSCAAFRMSDKTSTGSAEGRSNPAIVRRVSHARQQEWSPAAGGPIRRLQETWHRSRRGSRVRRRSAHRYGKRS